MRSLIGLKIERKTERVTMNGKFLEKALPVG